MFTKQGSRAGKFSLTSAEPSGMCVHRQRCSYWASAGEEVSPSDPALHAPWAGITPCWGQTVWRKPAHGRAALDGQQSLWMPEQGLGRKEVTPVQHLLLKHHLALLLPHPEGSKAQRCECGKSFVSSIQNNSGLSCRVPESRNL